MKRLAKKKSKWTSRHIELFLMAGLSIVWLFFFAYLPMCGIVLAFKDGDKALNIMRALLQSDWTLDNFSALFKDKIFWDTFWNTITINILMLVFNFPMPIIFALLLNEVSNSRVKTTLQSMANFPHFISWVIYGGIIQALTDMNTGIVNPILEAFGLSTPENPIDLNLAQYFYPKIIIATILKGIGWGSIVYTAAITSIDPSLYEAAIVDGARRWDRMVKITLPMILPTIMVFLLLNVARLLSNSFEQFYVFQSTENLSRTRVLATYLYSVGFTYRNYSTATAISLFEGIIAVVLLVGSNMLSKKLTGNGVF